MKQAEEHIMDFSEVLPFLEENHMAVVSTVTNSGSAQATVVSAGPYDGHIAFASRGTAVKVRNALRRGRATVTVLRKADNRYVTIEGPATVHGWDNTSPADLVPLLRQVYAAIGRPPKPGTDFDKAMEEEQRTVVPVAPERIYASL